MLAVYWATIGLLSVLCPGIVLWLLRKPSRAVEHAPSVPDVADVPLFTFDHAGLT